MWYNEVMRNWSTDVTELSKDPEKLAVWELEQRVNFGLQDDKLSLELLRKFWDKIKIDPARRSYLRHLLDVA